MLFLIAFIMCTMPNLYAMDECFLDSQMGQLSLAPTINVQSSDKKIIEIDADLVKSDNNFVNAPAETIEHVVLFINQIKQKKLIHPEFTYDACIDNKMLRDLFLKDEQPRKYIDIVLNSLGLSSIKKAIQHKIRPFIESPKMRDPNSIICSCLDHRQIILNQILNNIPVPSHILDPDPDGAVIAMSSDCSLCATCNEKEELIIWDIKTTNPIKCIIIPTESKFIDYACWSPDNKYLAFGAIDGNTITIWNLHDKKFFTSLEVPVHDSHNDIFYLNDFYIAANSLNYNNTIDIWYIPSHVHIGRFIAHDAEPTDISMVYKFCRENKSQLGVHPDSFDIGPLFQDNIPSITSICHSSTRRYTAHTGNKRSKITIFESSTKKIIKTIIPDNPIDQIAWSPDDCYIAIGLKRGAIQINDIKNSATEGFILIGQSKGYYNSIACYQNIKWSADGNQLLCLRNFEIQIFDLKLFMKFLQYLKHPQSIEEYALFNAIEKAIQENRPYKLNKKEQMTFDAISKNNKEVADAIRNALNSHVIQIS